MSKLSDLMEGNCKIGEGAFTDSGLTDPDWNYFPMVREIFSLCPPVHYSIFLAGIIPMTEEDGMLGFITLADWMTMDIHVCI